ncbi:unnamed protein product [Amoebophrya sp. A25]|nr:unnamed protein product [Amoebophrya sp. A25]|eukprot:GSA25T00027093001.1
MTGKMRKTVLRKTVLATAYLNLTDYINLTDALQLFHRSAARDSIGLDLQNMGAGSQGGGHRLGGSRTSGEGSVLLKEIDEANAARKAASESPAVAPARSTPVPGQDEQFQDTAASSSVGGVGAPSPTSPPAAGAEESAPARSTPVPGQVDVEEEGAEEEAAPEFPAVAATSPTEMPPVTDQEGSAAVPSPTSPPAADPERSGGQERWQFPWTRQVLRRVAGRMFPAQANVGARSQAAVGERSGGQEWQPRWPWVHGVTSKVFHFH